MIVNPFTSKTFVSIWSDHFNNSKAPISLEFIKHVTFSKHAILPLYINIGKNLTKGMNYTLDLNFNDYNRKVVLIYDVPSYFKVQPFIQNDSSTLKIKKTYQYPGYLMDITGFKDAESYIKSRFSSKNIRDIRSCERRLNECFKVRYQFYFGEISQSDYDTVFEYFYELLNTRFFEKNTNYHHLDEKKWTYYKSLVLPMILEKKASLLVVYDSDLPIGITLNFHSESILFETITVFDVNYHKFSIGKISIIRLLEWCFENGYQYSDFSKGDFEYKNKWSNVKYTFDYHILYDSKNFVSTSIATGLVAFFNLKAYLRDKKLNNFYRLILHKIKAPFNVHKHYKYAHFKFESLDNTNFVLADYLKIQIKDKNHSFILKAVYEFLFAHPEPIDSILVYKHLSNAKEFVIVGKEITQRVVFY